MFSVHMASLWLIINLKSRINLFRKLKFTNWYRSLLPCEMWCSVGCYQSIKVTALHTHYDNNVYNHCRGKPQILQTSNITNLKHHKPQTS